MNLRGSSAIAYGGDTRAMVGKTESRRLLVTYEAANGGPTSGVARDLALGGFFIETRQPLPVGSLVTVEVPSSASGSSPPIILDARVISIRTSRQGADFPPGMNVAFLDLPDRVLMQLQYVFERHRPPERTRLGVGESEPPFSAPPPAPEELEEIEVDDATARAAALAPAPLPIIEMPKAPAQPPAAMPPPSPVGAAPPAAPFGAPPPAFGRAPAPFGAPPPSFGPAPPPSSLGGLSTRVSIPDAAPRRNTALIVAIVVVAVVVVAAVAVALASAMS